MIITIVTCLGILPRGHAAPLSCHFTSTDTPLNGLTVSWRSEGTSDSIRWGYTEEYEQGEFAAVRGTALWLLAGTFFHFTFPHLEPSAVIHYSIKDSRTNVWSEDLTYRTAVDAGSPSFSFVVGGDSQSVMGEWEETAAAMAREDVDFALHAGDVTANAAVGLYWGNYFAAGEPFLRKTPVYYVRGNHDADSDDCFRAVLVLPGNENYYAFTFGSALFVCLNSQDPTGGAQLDLLKRVLEAGADRTWKFVWFHKPFYTQGIHDGEQDDFLDTWWKIFDDHGVDMLFCGHTHSYIRALPINRNVSVDTPVAAYGAGPGQGRCHIVTGGLGTSLDDLGEDRWFTAVSAMQQHYVRIDINGPRLSFAAKTVDGEVFDSLTLTKDGDGLLEPAAPVIVQQPQDQTIRADQSAAFTVCAVAHPAPLYQWQRDGQDLPHATGRTYVIPRAASEDNGAVFRCVATNAAGSAASEEATLSVVVPRFIRGDANASGQINISDPVYTLSYLFVNGPAPPCDDAADANDSGDLGLADAIMTFAHLFADGPPPPAPALTCGPDETADKLSCDLFPPCP